MVLMTCVAGGSWLPCGIELLNGCRQAMTKPSPPRVPMAQLAYRPVFGVFVCIYLGRVLNGTATKLDWVTLVVAAVLLVVTAYRVLISLGKPDA